MRIALLGEHNPNSATQRFTSDAVEHSATQFGIGIGWERVSSEEISKAWPERYQGLWVAPGPPHKNQDNSLQAIRVARENGIPCLGTCGGFQLMVVEYARHALGIDNAQHEEYAPDAENQVISRLACSLVGRQMTLEFQPGSDVAALYGTTRAEEHHYCNYGIAPAFAAQLFQGDSRATGRDMDNEIRVMELRGHPFFIGTLFVPQARSTSGGPHPLVSGFLRAVQNSDIRHNAS